jgi:hypothetical protein
MLKDTQGNRIWEEAGGILVAMEEYEYIYRLRMPLAQTDGRINPAKWPWQASEKSTPPTLNTTWKRQEAWQRQSYWRL